MRSISFVLSFSPLSKYTVQSTSQQREGLFTEGNGDAKKRRQKRKDRQPKQGVSSGNGQREVKTAKRKRQRRREKDRELLWVNRMHKMVGEKKSIENGSEQGKRNISIEYNTFLSRSLLV